MREIRVAVTSKPRYVGACLAGMMRESADPIELRAVGAEAISVALKSMAVTNRYLQERNDGFVAVGLPLLEEFIDSGGAKTLLKIIIFQIPPPEVLTKQ
jgi:stage V sporulation protein SpoVS